MFPCRGERLSYPSPTLHTGNCASCRAGNGRQRAAIIPRLPRLPLPWRLSQEHMAFPGRLGHLGKLSPQRAVATLFHIAPAAPAWAHVDEGRIGGRKVPPRT